MSYLLSVEQAFEQRVKLAWLEAPWYSYDVSFMILQTHGNVQHCSKSIANALELLQSYVKPSIHCDICIQHHKWETDFSKILIEFLSFLLIKLHFEVSSEKCQPFSPGGRFKNAYELLNLRALKISMLHKNCIFQCMGKIFSVEFQRYPLKFHTKYLTHTLKGVYFIHRWKFNSS